MGWSRGGEDGAGPSRQPLVAICLAGVVGVLIDRFAGVSGTAWLAIALVALALWPLALIQGGRRWGAGTVLVAVLAAAGLWHHAWWRWYPRTELGLAALDTAQPICARLRVVRTARYEPPAPVDPLCTMPEGDESQLTARVLAVRVGRAWNSASGRVRLTVRGPLQGVSAGDEIMVCGQLIGPRPCLNPGETPIADHGRVERQLFRLAADRPECVRVERYHRSWSLSGGVDRLRQRAEDQLWRYVGPRRAGLAAAMILGVREQVDARRNDEFLATGTIHLLSVSGLHVATVAYGFWLLGRLGLVPRRVTLVLVVAFVSWYALLTDARPPVVRATVLVAMMSLARFAGRQALSFNTLATAGLVVLALNPASLFLAGTQLSFLAVATIACWTARSASDETVDPLQRLIAESRPWPLRMLQAVFVALKQAARLSAVVWFTSLPLVLYRFHLVSLIAPLINPLVCLPMAWAMVAGFGVIIGGEAAPPLARLCGSLCDGCLGLMELGVDGALWVPGNHVWGPAPPGWWVMGFYALAAAAVVRPDYLPSRRWCLVAVLTWMGLGALFVWGSPARQTGPDEMTVTFVAVGHGTSVLVEMPDGSILLYDAGRLGSPASALRPIAAVLWSRGISNLDTLVVSHADADHFNAIPLLLSRFRVRQVIVSTGMFRDPAPAVGALQQAIMAHRIPLSYCQSGEPLIAGERHCRVEVLHPPDTPIAGSDNANSIVLALYYRGRSVILPGDIESPGSELLMRQAVPPGQILMVPHHGSTHSDPGGFARWCLPQVAVISAAAGRGAAGVRRAYESVGARVFHTAEDGALTISITASGTRVEAFRQR